MENYFYYYNTRKYVVTFYQEKQRLTIAIYDKTGNVFKTLAEKVYNKCEFKSDLKAFKDLRKSFNI